MAPDITWSSGDSGAHGIYLENTLDAEVRDNVIYRNRFRGLQLWPRNDGAEIHHNVFDENATQVNIGSSNRVAVAERGGFVRAHKVHDNIFSNRVADWRPSQNPSQVYGYFLEGSPDYGNEVGGNCFAPGDPTATGAGFAAHDNDTLAVRYVDRAGRDYRLTESSPCQGRGPRTHDARPSSRPDAMVRRDGGRWVGDDVYNRTGAAQTVRVRVARGETALVRVRIVNDGDTLDQWAVAEARSHPGRVARTWRSGGRDVTTLVAGGNLLFGDVPVGGVRSLSLRVTPDAKAPVGSVATWYLHRSARPAQ